MRQCRAILVAVSVLSLLAPGVRAQNAPGSPGAGGARPQLQFDPPEVTLSLRGLYNSSSLRPAEGGSLTGHDTVLEQLLTVKTGGSAWGIAEFSIGVTVGLDEMWQREPNGKNTDVDAHYEYDVGLTLFPRSPMPLEFRASRTIEYTSQPFSETYRTTQNNYEAAWSFKNANLTSDFRLFHNDLRQQSFTGQDNFRHEQNGVSWDAHLALGERQNLDWNYTFRNVTQTDPFGHTASFDAHTLNMTHEYRFGTKPENTLTSSVDYLNQDGAFTQEHFSITEDLRLRHTDRFETFYQYQFDKTRYPEADSTLNRLKGGFRHKLFDDLLVTGTLGGLTLDQSGAGTDEWFADLNFDYNRKVPLGQLTAGLRLSLDRQSNQAQDSEVHVLQTRTFDASQQIVIPRVGINVDTVNLRNASGTTIYSNGFDFLASYHKNRLVIDRIPGGNLPADSTVLLDFDLMPQPANVVLTSGIDLNARYDFNESFLKGLSLYTRYVYQQQDISSDVPGAFVPDDINAILAGVEYRIWRIKLTAEHEDHQSNLAPYHSDRFSIRYEDRIARDWRIAIDATRFQTLYTDDHSDPVATTLSGRLQYKPTRGFSAAAGIAYMDLRDRLVSHAHGLEESLELQWTVRDTTVRAEVRHSDLDTDTQNSSNFFFLLTLERRF